MIAEMRRAKSGIVMPDFVVIGGSKCGTQWIHECLREHPQIFLTRETPEIFFFDRYFDRGVDWYARYFLDYAGQKRVGDVTSTYLAHPNAATRLKQVLPDATLLVSLRNPVERAWSRYLHMWRKGDIEPSLTFRQAWQVAPQILNDGDYAAHLTRWLTSFNRSQIHLLVLDDAQSDAGAFLRRIYTILGVDPGFRAAFTDERTNEHQTPRSLLLARIAFRFSRFLHRNGLHRGVEFYKRSGLKRLVLHSNREYHKEPGPLSTEDRSWLAARYRSDVEQLSSLVDRDLCSLWLGASSHDVRFHVDRRSTGNESSAKA
jgi:hypothetical protein